MRRITLFICTVFIAVFGFGQTCISDQNIKDVGFHPKSIEPAYVDSMYKQVLQVRIFKDTSVVIDGTRVLAIIDSIVVTGIDGMPDGFYYTCSHKKCTFVPDSTGCATLQGIAKRSDVGEHPLDIRIKVYAKIFGTISTTQTDTIRQFTMLVQNLNSTGNLLPNRGIIFPNPTTTGNVFVSNTLLDEIQSVTCLNSLGQVVDYELSNGKISIKNNGVGLFTIHLTTVSGKTISQRVLFVD